ncbi:MAG: aconitate hydratase AcnA [Bacteriovoracaceae bacterium]|nr:aconitate hydratase AcnA [Bacteriovoracaceae bacterium]
MSTSKRLDSFKVKKTLKVGNKNYDYFSLKAAEAAGVKGVSQLPYSLKVLLENLLRCEDGFAVYKEDIEALGNWIKNRSSDKEINFYPARVLMQDFTGVPAVVDLAVMRDAMKALGGDVNQINPLSQVDLVIDHSVTVDVAGSDKAFDQNVNLEFERNQERYEFLKWGQKAFRNFRVVPPGTGICHQVNLENLAQVVWTAEEGANSTLAYCDTLVGTDSHTTMINGLSVLGWGVGGIEAEAAMLGQAVTMLIPEVIGFKLSGKLPEGTTATDLVLTVTQMLRQKGVVGKFVEFFGPGLSELSLADRATIANMAPEYGATCGFFPIDNETINYLTLTGRSPERIALVEAYAKEQGLWRDESTPAPIYTDSLELDMATVVPSLSGPRRPQDKIALVNVAKKFEEELKNAFKVSDLESEVNVEGEDYALAHGDVVIAAITSCTNTSNPAVMLAAGLVAKKAVERGLSVPAWVKTSLAPGSQVVTDYLIKAGLQKSLDTLGFQLVGYGCTTCIGNSGPLTEKISAGIKKGNLVAASVLSGNRNFEGRIGPDVKANFLASPPLVVAYALAGSVRKDLSKEPIGVGRDGIPVYLKDIWPSNKEVQTAVNECVKKEMFQKRYSNVFDGTEDWKKIQVTESSTYSWNPKSTYVRKPPYFEGMGKDPVAINNITKAKVLAIFGDSITTDHISPAGSIKADSPAGLYLQDHGVKFKDFNSYGARRGNHEVMMRGTFANIRIKNEMLDNVEGGLTKMYPSQEVVSIYDAAMKYQKEGTPLVIFGGKEYGTGSSRDWAAKGPYLQGVKAVVCESFERIHRSNLIGMGILPLQFTGNQTRKTLKLIGNETISIDGIASGLAPKSNLTLEITRSDGSVEKVTVLCRIDTGNELEYFKNGGILHYVLRKLRG